MNGVAKFVTVRLQGQPATAQELAEALQYPMHRVLKGILDARAEGAPIFCRLIPGEPSLFEVRSSATIDDAPSMEGQSE